MSIFSKLFGNSPSDPDPIEDADELILRSLQESGIDVTHDLPLDFLLYFPGEHEARLAMRDGERAGYDAEIHPPPSEDLDWMVVLSRRMTPSLVQLKEERVRLDELAAAHDGEFEGWDVARDD